MEKFLYLAMFFCHVIDDYKLQAGVLNNLKCKSWWEENAPDKKYRNDYLMGLIMHGMSWSFMIMLPVAIFYRFNVPTPFVFAWAINASVHSIIDDLKANRGKLNLIQDQLLHVIQIAITGWYFLYR